MMIILLGFYKRRPDLSWEQFSDHWRNVHGPLMRDTPESARYIRRYVQHHIRPNTLSPNIAHLEFDGFSEAWFDSVEAREEMHRQSIFAEIMYPDEAKFLDMTATRYSMLDVQHTIIGAEAQPAPLWDFGG
jgi:uncharacterized protein (TIGR02118 family)